MSLPENSVHPKNINAWRAWLDKHHERLNGVWFVYYKKSAHQPTISYNEAVEEALCFGWIDSKPRKLDAERSMLWFAPRRSRTGWSALNKTRIKRLELENKMMPAGRAKIEEAKQDGSWELLDDVEKLIIPDDLALELQQYSAAKKYFEAFPPSVRRGILEWILQAKRPETRQKRIKKTAAMAQDNQRANQWSRS